MHFQRWREVRAVDAREALVAACDGEGGTWHQQDFLPRKPLYQLSKVGQARVMRPQKHAALGGDVELPASVAQGTLGECLLGDQFVLDMRFLAWMEWELGHEFTY